MLLRQRLACKPPIGVMSHFSAGPGSRTPGVAMSARLLPSSST